MAQSQDSHTQVIMQVKVNEREKEIEEDRRYEDTKKVNTEIFHFRKIDTAD